MNELRFTSVLVRVEKRKKTTSSDDDDDDDVCDGENIQSSLFV